MIFPQCHFRDDLQNGTGYKYIDMRYATTTPFILYKELEQPQVLISVRAQRPYLSLLSGSCIDNKLEIIS